MTLATFGVQIVYTIGRVEIGWDDDCCPVMRDTRTGSIVRGTRALFTHDELKQCATDWDTRLDEAERLAVSILGAGGYNKLAKLYGIEQSA